MQVEDSIKFLLTSCLCRDGMRHPRDCTLARLLVTDQHASWCRVSTAVGSEIILANRTIALHDSIIVSVRSAVFVQ